MYHYVFSCNKCKTQRWKLANFEPGECLLQIPYILSNLKCVIMDPGDDEREISSPGISKNYYFLKKSSSEK